MAALKGRIMNGIQQFKLKKEKFKTVSDKLYTISLGPEQRTFFNQTQALMSWAFLVTFVSVYTCVHVFLITFMLVNMFALIVF
jgi:hypothetical protein